MSERDLALATREERLDDYVYTRPIATPAAATDIAPVSVPGGEVWRLLAVTGRLSCSANAGSRFASLVVDDGTNQLCRVAINAAQTANIVSVDYTWTLLSAQAGSASTGNAVAMALPPFPLSAGWRFSISTLNIQAGDQWSRLFCVYELLPEGGLARYGGLALVEQMEDMAWDAAHFARQA